MNIKYLLVVVILAAIVGGTIFLLDTLFSSDSPGVHPDAQAIATMAQIQAKAELIKNTERTYNKLFCIYDDAMEIFCNDIEERIGKKPIIHTSENKYCAYINLTRGGYYCIDSTGFREEINTNVTDSGYCDGKTFSCSGKKPEDETAN